MTMGGSFFSREELLGGLPARRASTLLFAIESRTARLVARAQQDSAWYLTAGAAREREQAFLQALAQGRDAPALIAVQDLERYAPQWASLLPETRDAGLNAAMAHLLAQKYRFTRAAVPRLRAALELDSADVRRAYQRLHNRPLEAIYAPQASLGERLRFAWAGMAGRIEALPPFWIAFGLTLPVGPGLLALPIALAQIGPLAGVVLLILFGLLNMLTAAALAEAVARSGITRFGLGYLGQLVSDYLGDAGSVFLSLVSFLNNVLVLVVFYLGIAGTLAGATGLPAELWIAAVFGAGLYFLSRKSLNTTVAFTLVVVAINLTLVLLIPLPALPRVQAANLAFLRLPFVAGQPFDPSILTLVFGVMLTNYFSHMLVANYSRVVLRRDPSARSWIWGSMASIGVTTAISCVWVVIVNGAIAPEVLAAEAGTVLRPLAALAGPAITWMGSVLVVLGLGIATVHISLGTFFLVQERLPGSLQGRARFLLSIVPIALVFATAEWLSLTGSGSFAGLLGFVGVVSLPLLGGVFPMLLLAASRRKGDFVPGVVYRLLGHPVVAAVIYLIFLSSMFVYGLFIYTGAAERIATLAVGLLVLAATAVILRRGALQPRLVVELRQDQTPGGASLFSVTAAGNPAPAQVTLAYRDRAQQVSAAKGEVPDFGALRSATIQLPQSAAGQLKVWAHTLTPEGNSEGLPAQVNVNCGETSQTRDLAQSGGQTLLPLGGAPCEVQITR